MAWMEIVGKVPENGINQHIANCCHKLIDTHRPSEIRQ